MSADRDNLLRHAADIDLDVEAISLFDNRLNQLFDEQEAEQLLDRTVGLLEKLKFHQAREFGETEGLRRTNRILSALNVQLEFFIVTEPLQRDDVPQKLARMDTVMDRLEGHLRGDPHQPWPSLGDPSP